MGENFAIKLRDLRQSYGMTQTELAMRLGVGRTTVSEYERGTIEPKRHTIYKIARIFNVDTDYLMRDTSIDWTRPIYDRYIEYNVKNCIQDVLFNIQDSNKNFVFGRKKLTETQLRIIEESLKNIIKITEISMID